MKIEDVVFFGAGASASEGAPLQGALFKDYFTKEQGAAFLTNDPHMDQRLQEFFNIFWGIDVKDGDLRDIEFPTFEEALGILELAISREESFREYGLLLDRPLIRRIREDLIFLMALIIDRKLSAEGEHHRTLVKRLEKENKISKAGFVSLNYDILIDNALMDIYPVCHLDYGVEFTNFKRPGDWSIPEPQKAVYLYKLHGSLNWLYCPTCISLTLTPKEKRVATLIFKPKQCDFCGSKVIPIIIPPTFFKVMSNYYLQQIWHKAGILLSEVKRIFFCGYSFPDADIHVKYLIKRMEVNSRNTPEIFIINNHKEKSREARDSEQKRYVRFFNKSDRVNYTDLSFEDFCARGI
jgi:hypothetical protein